ncbi:MAG TPA: hypothetical protein VE621_12375 [Bryobacteraceae bacterium]|nr:hypothetical protein [Bryobacteraceae bacterium]
MDQHVRTLGVLNVIYGIVGLLVSAGFLIGQGNLHNIYEAFNDEVFALLGVTYVITHLVVGIPCALFGYLVMKHYPPARIGLIVTSALNILVVPLGTILGAYGLWVLMTPEVEPLFARARKKKAAAKRGSKLQETEDPKTVKNRGTSILPASEQ